MGSGFKWLGVAYAQALVTSPVEQFTRRRFVSGYEREDGQGD